MCAILYALTFFTHRHFCATQTVTPHLLARKASPPLPSKPSLDANNRELR